MRRGSYAVLASFSAHRFERTAYKHSPAQGGLLSGFFRLREDRPLARAGDDGCFAGCIAWPSAVSLGMRAIQASDHVPLRLRVGSGVAYIAGDNMIDLRASIFSPRSGETSQQLGIGRNKSVGHELNCRAAESLCTSVKCH